ncbi:MAG TPA: hypothetical protein PLS77_09540 [Anaerolineaceae bacterium]|nr:hypothetical protein [Anaerolineaceae bacterium]HQF46135.1 hypothetical protein [Anaerolineaceae bacterium]HQH35937.1 hypothetical protein [Anaerolineaceae bacterium]HQJ03928.1 hypothetical protein [Anaerolineaceae bacterium]
MQSFSIAVFLSFNYTEMDKKSTAPHPFVQCSRGVFGWQGMADKAQPAPPGNTLGADGRIHIQPIPDRKPRL